MLEESTGDPPHQSNSSTPAETREPEDLSGKSLLLSTLVLVI